MEGEEEEEEGDAEAEDGEKGEGEEDEEGEKEGEEEVEEQATARQVRITRAMKRTYIQVKDNGGTWRLIVQVTEKASDNQREATHTICTAMLQDMGIGKEQLLATRKDILQWH